MRLPCRTLSAALGIIRSRAKDWGIDPDRIGVLGFSAGGHLAATLSTHESTRTYEPIDEADRMSSLPNFALLIYPAYLVDVNNGNRIAPELTITKDTPPTFLVQTQDDGVHVECSLFYYLALTEAGVPAELHAYPSGGHGYGLRPRTMRFLTGRNAPRAGCGLWESWNRRSECAMIRPLRRCFWNRPHATRSPIHRNPALVRGLLISLIVLLALGLLAFALFRPDAGPPPPEIADDPLLIQGRELYLARCVSCHGPKGEGNGVLSKDMKGPPPSDLASGKWKHGDRPQDVLGVIANGARDGQMPGWKSVYNDEQMRAVAAYVYYLAGRPVPDPLRQSP